MEEQMLAVGVCSENIVVIVSVAVLLGMRVWFSWAMSSFGDPQ